MLRVGGMPWLQTCAVHYHVQLGLPDKGCAMKGLVVCYVAWLESIIYGMCLWIIARNVVWSTKAFLNTLEMIAALFLRITK